MMSIDILRTIILNIARKAIVKVLLIKDIQRTPQEGIGKPEPLKHGLSGYWSRRINDEHRIVYKHQGNTILIAQLGYHYGI
ncbi:Txe/YoeB family addiction module toxin [Vibrio sp. S11_S32]|uniref:Txe/YoeB family addiction module toxin n=1 Tax=Vibrio sp. S11_S32 TaxID=2720225 RepID=UPI0016806686|nr:Txe/YoeB family addiction module toxin [Vibrio sp. S11_S32]MBD1578021.1 Txe/YoeB family addiction module toxin [Vibrio sp. S11_S32]